MRTWQEFATERSELAAAGEDLFRTFTIGYLATLRADGSPRVHPVTVTLHDGRLYISTIAGTLKQRDLLRDGRFALHTFPRTPGVDSWDDEEFMVGGLAERVADADERSRVVAVHNDTVGAEDTLFHLRLERAFHKSRREGKPIHDTWRERPDGSPR